MNSESCDKEEQVNSANNGPKNVFELKKSSISV